MAGRSTFTATSRPSVVTAKWTWAIDAAATGTSSKLLNKAAIGWPSSVSMVRRASAPEKAGRWSCRRARSTATLSLKRSERVDSAWPSLMKDGPISCSAAASRSPGRRASRRRANSRAHTTSAGTMPSVSSGNSASCRARLSAMRSRRQVLRIARSILAGGAPLQWRVICRFRGRSRHGSGAPPAKTYPRHMRQPLCSATTPSVMSRQATLAKPALRMRSAKTRCVGKRRMLSCR